jgi:hypothetical protein
LEVNNIEQYLALNEVVFPVEQPRRGIKQKLMNKEKNNSLERQQHQEENRLKPYHHVHVEIL